MSSDFPLVVIVGPTASGKTALAIELAKMFDGEIVCADSRTVYTGLDIGTAKPTREERSEVPHHLLDVVDLDEPFTVADFKRLAEVTIADISRRGRLPILVGGSGLYIDAVLYDYSFSDGGARDEVNPRHANASSEHHKSELRDNTIMIGLRIEPDVLRRRITARVGIMLREGFLDEVERVVAQYPTSKALDAPGYRAFREYLRGGCTLEQATEKFAQNDYQLSRRQMTWFRRNPAIQWFTDPGTAREFVVNRLMDSRNSGKNTRLI